MLTPEEKTLLLSVLEQIQVRGEAQMRLVLSIMEKLRKTEKGATECAE